MNKELKAKWVNALRSGKYKQCQGVLRKKEGRTKSYCCLGVLREIMEPGSDDVHEEWSALSSTMSAVAGLECYGMNEGNQQRLLAEMNDGGSSFKAIADHIEANL